MTQKVEEIRMNCRCGRPTYMDLKDFEKLVFTDRVEGLLCDNCDKPMVTLVFDPLSET
jgi:hypothetical protein